MIVARKQPKIKEYKRCELCNDGSKVAGNHKNSVRHMTKQNSRNALDYGLVTIKIPEFKYYTSSEYSATWSRLEGLNFNKSHEQVPIPFGNIWLLDTEYSYGSYAVGSPSLQREYWVKSEDLIEIYFELINIAVQLEHEEETVTFHKYKKESDDYDAFLEKHGYHYEKDDILPDLDYKDTLLDLQYGIVQFPHIRKTILIIKEKDSDQFTIRTFKYYQDLDDEDCGIEETIFGWGLIRIIEREGNVVRQGDLYLQPIPKDQEVEFPSEDAQHTWEENGYENHKAEMLGVYQEQVVIKGKLEHPEHKDLTLKKWHRIITEDFYD